MIDFLNEYFWQMLAAGFLFDAVRMTLSRNKYRKLWQASLERARGADCSDA